MDEQNQGVAAEKAATENETLSEMPPGTNELAETSEPDGASAVEEERKERKIPVNYERFTELNREAKLARKIKQRLGMDEAQLEELLEKEGEDAPAAAIAPNTLNKRIAALEETIEQTRSALSKQNEAREWEETAVKNPDLAPFRETIIELGRTGKYKNMPYSEIYKQVFAPVVKSGYSKAYTKQQEKELAQLHKGKGEAPKDGEITEVEFKKLPLDKKKAYLKSIGVDVD